MDRIGRQSIEKTRGLLNLKSKGSANKASVSKLPREARKALRKAQKASRKANRGTSKGQKTSSGRKSW